ncbi:MAG: hypothetical protein CVU95_12540 [Firmicutes bacterium HGW-Firmicutes-2]|nr:MAG: hypothetical protein CVU95_12540 [Firmicutes bacterium HGW-Firmicutes-2]
MGVVFVLGGLVILCFIMILYQQKNRDKQLITDNPILTIPTQTSSKAVIISTFGMLSEHKCYRWGYKGVKLISVVLDKEKIYLSFGKGEHVKHVSIYHEMVRENDLKEVCQKFLYETGVVVNIENN